MPFRPRVAHVYTAATAVMATVVFGYAWFYRFNDPGGSFAYLTDDHFFYVVRGWQILFGDLPVRDFVDHGAPLYYYVAAAVQQLFGRGTLSEIAFSVTVLAGCAVGVFLLARRATSSMLLGAVAAAVFIILEPRFYNYPKILVYVAAIPILWSFADRPGFGRTAALAVVAVLGFLFRHDHGVFVSLAFAALLVLLRQLSWWARIRHALVYGGLVLVLLAPYLFFIQTHGGLSLYFTTALAWAERDRGRAEVVWPGLFDLEGEEEERVAADAGPVERLAAGVRANRVAWFYYSEIALPIVALAALALASPRAQPSWPHAGAKIGAVAILGLALDAGFLRAPLEARLADPAVPIVILLAWLPVGIFGMLRDGLRPRPAARAVGVYLTSAFGVVLLAVMTYCMVPGLRDRIEAANLERDFSHARDRAELMWTQIGESFPVTIPEEAPAERLLTLSVYLRECTAPTDRILVQHYTPQVVALAERGFAGGHADLRPGFFKTEAMQRLTVERLQRQSVPIALVGTGDAMGGFRDSFPIVSQYLDANYRVAGERTFDGRFDFRLLVRRDARPVREFAPLGWPCFR